MMPRISCTTKDISFLLKHEAHEKLTKPALLFWLVWIVRDLLSRPTIARAAPPSSLSLSHFHQHLLKSRVPVCLLANEKGWEL